MAQDCYNGITSVRVINENNVAAKQRQAAMAVWNRCNKDKKSLDHDCLAKDFVKKVLITSVLRLLALLLPRLRGIACTPTPAPNVPPPYGR